MAICRIIQTPATPDQYDQVRTRVGVGEGSLPPGAQLHVAAIGEDGKIQIFEVWDSREQAEAFGEKVQAAREELGVGAGVGGGPAQEPTITYLEAHRVLTA